MGASSSGGVRLAGGEAGVVLRADVWRQLQGVEARGNAGFIAGLVARFLEDAARRLGMINSLARGGDLDRVAREALRLEQGCDQVGAAGMADTCRQLRDAADGDRPRDVVRLAGQLLRQFETLRGALPRT